MAKKTEKVNTFTIDLGESTQIATSSLDPKDKPFNFILVHRHYDPLLQKWGNACSKIVSMIAKRDDDGKIVYGYQRKLFKFCYKQYDKYGDYYRIIDNAGGKYENDRIIEIQ